jgi:hypothetical protein
VKGKTLFSDMLVFAFGFAWRPPCRRKNLAAAFEIGHFFYYTDYLNIVSTAAYCSNDYFTDVSKVATDQFCGFADFFNTLYRPSKRRYSKYSDIPISVTYLRGYFKRRYEFVPTWPCNYHWFPYLFFRSALCKDGKNMSPTFQISVRGENIGATRYLFRH